MSRMTYRGGFTGVHAALRLRGIAATALRLRGFGYGFTRARAARGTHDTAQGSRATPRSPCRLRCAPRQRHPDAGDPHPPTVPGRPHTPLTSAAWAVACGAWGVRSAVAADSRLCDCPRASLLGVLRWPAAARPPARATTCCGDYRLYADLDANFTIDEERTTGQ